MAALVLIAALLVLPAQASLARDDDCEHVIYDHNDEYLKLRTMVVQDHSQQRSLVIMDEKDTSMPCQLMWWLQHNPQGLVKCENADSAEKKGTCSPTDCGANPDIIENGYVRTMLASALLAPASHEMSAICIEMGCRARITRTRLPGGFLQADDAVSEGEAPWVPRRKPQNLLVIGLGSSSMALWLRKHYPDTTLHVAELVPSVVASAPCFGLDTNDPGLHLHAADGRAFLKNSTDGQYDAILIDAFDPDAGVPSCFRTGEFFALAKSKLAQGGALSFNLLNQKTSPGVLKSLAENFDADRVWIGDAPGAEGIQHVVTAFSSGRSVAPADDKVTVSQQGEQWFESAKYRAMDPKVLDGVEGYQDKDLCSTSA